MHCCFHMGYWGACIRSLDFKKLALHLIQSTNQMITWGLASFPACTRVEWKLVPLCGLARLGASIPIISVSLSRATLKKHQDHKEARWLSASAVRQGTRPTTDPLQAVRHSRAPHRPRTGALRLRIPWSMCLNVRLLGCTPETPIHEAWTGSWESTF